MQFNIQSHRLREKFIQSQRPLCMGISFNRQWTSAARHRQCNASTSDGIGQSQAQKMAQIQWSSLQAKDIMTAPVVCIQGDEEILKAMRLMVSKGISGMPVVERNGIAVGAVSGYDLLTLDTTPGKLPKEDGFFPPVDRCVKDFGGDRQAMWTAFKELRSRAAKANAQVVSDVMHDVITVTQDTSVEDIANQIVQKKLQRICVVDDNKKVVGVVSRGDIMRGYLNCYNEFIEESSDDEDEVQD